MALIDPGRFVNGLARRRTNSANLPEGLITTVSDSRHIRNDLKLMQDWRIRGLIAVGIGTAGTLLLAAWTKRDACFYFNNQPKELIPILSIWWFLTLCVVLPPKRKRLGCAAGGVSVVLIAAAFTLPTDSPYASWGLRESALTVLRANVKSLREYHIQHGEYPQEFDATPRSERLRKYFKMNYFPVRSLDGTVAAYRIEVRPAHPPCGCPLSLTTSEDGKVFSTEQSRAANQSQRTLVRFVFAKQLCCKDVPRLESHEAGVSPVSAVRPVDGRHSGADATRAHDAGPGAKNATGAV
jgi:hypothetical protein